MVDAYSVARFRFSFNQEMALICISPHLHNSADSLLLLLITDVPRGWFDFKMKRNEMRWGCCCFHLMLLLMLLLLRFSGAVYWVVGRRVKGQISNVWFDDLLISNHSGLKLNGISNNLIEINFNPLLLAEVDQNWTSSRQNWIQIGWNWRWKPKNSQNFDPFDLKLTKIDGKRPKMVKIVIQLTKIDQNWPNLIIKDQKWSKLWSIWSEIDQNWPKLTKIDGKRPKMVQILIHLIWNWPKLIKIGWNWPKMVKIVIHLIWNWPKLVEIDQNWLKIMTELNGIEFKPIQSNEFAAAIWPIWRQLHQN